MDSLWKAIICIQRAITFKSVWPLMFILMLSHLDVLSHHLWPCRLLHKCPLYNHSFVPRLLDGLHPFIALTLLLGPQLQRLLSIMAKHNEEVVLRRQRQKREKLFIFVTLRPNTSTSPLISCTNSLALHKMLLGAPLRRWPQLTRHMETLLSTAFAFHALFLPRFFPY